MNTTYKIFLRTDNKNNDGTNTIYLRFTSRRKLKNFSLNISIKEKDWDSKKSQARKTNIDYLRKNKYIRKYSNKAQKIIDKYFFDEKYLSIDEFARNFKDESFGSTSFYEFIENEMKTLNIAAATLDDYKKQILKLQSFRKNLAFTDIDLRFIQDYDHFLRTKRNNTKNTRLNSFKFIKQVINKAIKRDIVKENPFKNFPIERMQSKKEHLTKIELERLYELLQSGRLNITQKNVLTYFLFACYTGLRYQDTFNLRFKDVKLDTINGIEYKFIQIDMHKTGKPIDIPVLSIVGKFLKQGLPNQKVFKVLTNQATNRNLKLIMNVANIDKNISFHTARHTLGTTGSDLGMRIEVISAILGHTKLATTQIYTKISRQSKVNELMKMEEEN